MIVVTGTPGTGKTTVGKLMAKRLRLPFLAVNSLVRKKRLYSHVDGGSMVVDPADLRRALRGFGGLAEGHLLCEIKLPAKCVVLRASPKTIMKRLAPRHYPKQKLRDNVEAEALDYCAIKARQHYKTVIEVDTTGLSPAQSAAKALRCLRSGESDRIDWSDYFLQPDKEAIETVRRFHSSRRMFAIVDGKLLIAKPRDRRSHTEWLGSVHGVTRGFVDAKGDVYFYTGASFDIADRGLVLRFLPELSRRLKLNPKAQVFSGMLPWEGAGQWPGKKRLGAVAGLTAKP